jgi:Cytidine and deoxycytidylate deaminase zinc-binding region
LDAPFIRENIPTFRIAVSANKTAKVRFYICIIFFDLRIILRIGGLTPMGRVRLAHFMSSPSLTPVDEAFLRRAIELTREARADGRHPFGSLIVDAAGAIVVESRNNAVRPGGDPTQHAELLACAAAARFLSDAELATCTLYTSTEPCQDVLGSHLLDGNRARGFRSRSDRVAALCRRPDARPALPRGLCARATRDCRCRSVS